MRHPLARLTALALSALLAVTTTLPPLVPAGVLLFTAGDAAAQSRGRSSGGYSRPSSSPRTPSTSSGYGAPRTPSSGGYGRPSGGGSSGSIFGGGSAGDRSYGREQSGNVLREMRAREEAARRAAEQAARPTPQTGGGWSGSTGGGWSGGWGDRRTPSYNDGYRRGGYAGGYSGGYPGGYSGGWYRDRGWTPSPSVASGPGNYGVWSTAFLFFLLSTLSSPGHADFFRNNQDDPGVRQFRQAAEQRAGTDPEIRRQLDELDRRTAEAGNLPREPGALPPDVPPEVARARPDSPASAGASAGGRTPSAAPGGGGSGIGGFLTVGVILLALILGFMIWRRMRAAPKGGEAMGPGGMLQKGADIIRHKMSGEGYTPSRFRIGMTLTVDPTPFLLLAGETKVPAPSGTAPTSVTAVGRIGGDGPGSLIRLYLPEGAFFQLHLGPGNEPDECRYFAPLDEVNPADVSEWNLWLDPNEGMIGWPEFQTKDGKVYGRAWSPSDAKIAPREMSEEVETTEGRRTVRRRAMLYAAPTGAAEPAPQTEYILVAAVEDGRGAWVEIHAGLDVSPASLSLA
ncbi:DUF2491 family protein [Muricoccus radiodurans]|uniref:DUF2491 family protein n=1 Tax=Muricoccus radiodurans TaxID=2231721 RepID=UPI003CEE3E75